MRALLEQWKLMVSRKASGNFLHIWAVLLGSLFLLVAIMTLMYFFVILFVDVGRSLGA